MIHLGAFAVVKSGKVLASQGDIDALVALRSCGKPFQLAAMLEAGLARYGLDARSIAFMGSSHNGESEHLAQLADLLSIADVSVSDLQCGTHVPYRSWVTRSPATNNCSGKHAAMLLTARTRGWDLATYLSPENPLQIAIKSALSLRFREICPGLDGCGAPTFGVPLIRLAHGFSALAEGASPSLATVAEAYVEQPFMLAGTDRIESYLNGEYRVVMKPGSDGLWAGAIPSQEVGFAIKIRSGNENAASLVAVYLLQALDVLSIAQDDEVKRLLEWGLTTGTGRAAGTIEVTSSLDRAVSSQ